jgi:hypothetical protein
MRREVRRKRGLSPIADEVFSFGAEQDVRKIEVVEE